MARYIGGPLDGLELSTRYDHLPVIRLHHPRSAFSEPKTVESYRKGADGHRHHQGSEPYPNMVLKISGS